LRRQRLWWFWHVLKKQQARAHVPLPCCEFLMSDRCDLARQATQRTSQKWLWICAAAGKQQETVARRREQATKLNETERHR
jgi:hypothetical protein